MIARCEESLLGRAAWSESRREGWLKAKIVARSGQQKNRACRLGILARRYWRIQSRDGQEYPAYKLIDCVD